MLRFAANTLASLRSSLTLRSSQLLLEEYDLDVEETEHVSLANINGDAFNDLIIGESTGHIRYFEGEGFECTSCLAGR